MVRTAADVLRIVTSNPVRCTPSFTRSQASRRCLRSSPVQSGTVSAGAPKGSMFASNNHVFWQSFTDLNWTQKNYPSRKKRHEIKTESPGP